VEHTPRIALHHPSDEDLLLHPSEQRPLAGDPESAGNPVRSIRGYFHRLPPGPPAVGLTAFGEAS